MESFQLWIFPKMCNPNGATLNVTELFSKAILLTMFVYGDCMAVWFYTPVSNSVEWLSTYLYIVYDKAQCYRPSNNST